MTTTIRCILCCLLIGSLAYAQTPQGINYQAVLRLDDQIQTDPVDITFELHRKSDNQLVYKETHINVQPGSNSGLVNLVLGSDNPIGTPAFDQMDWGGGPFELLVSVRDLSSGGIFTFGPSDLQSVAYSLYAETAGSVEQLSLSDLDDVMINNPGTSQVLSWNGSTWEAATITSATFTAGPGISISNDEITNTEPDQIVSITGTGAATVSGTYPNFTIDATDLVDDADADPANELQQLSLVGNALSISGPTGNSVTLPAGTAYSAGAGISLINDIITNTQPDQIVSITGSGAAMVSGTYPNFTIDATDLVDDADADPSNEIQQLSLNGDTLSINGAGGNSVVFSTDDVLSDLDDDTRVSVEESPDEDKIRFDIAGQEGLILQYADSAGAMLRLNPGGTNIFIGDSAGMHTVVSGQTLGERNTFIGQRAGIYNTTGFRNTGVGRGALLYNTTAAFNVAIGYGTLTFNTVGSSNVGVGDEALFNNTEGGANVAVGRAALRQNQTGTFNTAVGNRALTSNRHAFNNTAVGNYALAGDTSGTDNVAVGNFALRNNQSGIENTAIGSEALRSNTIGNYNTAVGGYAFHFGQGNANTAIGHSALYSDSAGFANVAIGNAALFSNKTGFENTAAGVDALKSNTGGTYNVAVGTRALQANTTGGFNTAIGVDVLANAAITFANTAIGHGALQSDSSGSANVAIGNASLNGNISGFDNVAVGVDALKVNVDGYSNTAVGKDALESNTSGLFNVAIGANALKDNATGGFNTAIGVDVLANAGNSIANTAVGHGTLQNDTSGVANAAFGNAALNQNLEGNDNTAIGVDALFGNLSGNQNTALGKSTFSVADSFSNSTGIGYNAEPFASNRVRLGNSSVNNIGGYASWSNISDGRYKFAVQENIPGLDFILKLRPVSYQMDIGKLAESLKEDYEPNKEGRLVYEKPDAFTLQSREAKSQARQTGFIAQEVEQAAKDIQYEFSGVNQPQHAADHYSISYAEFVVPLVKAVQEQQQMIQDMQQTIQQLQAELQQLKSK